MPPRTRTQLMPPHTRTQLMPRRLRWLQLRSLQTTRPTAWPRALAGHSYRWLRFPCCGRAHPCAMCHEASDCPAASLGVWATRMLCGKCSREMVRRARRARVDAVGGVGRVSRHGPSATRTPREAYTKRSSIARARAVRADRRRSSDIFSDCRALALARVYTLRAACATHAAQPYSDSPCAHCGNTFTKPGGAHWQGGAGMRDQQRLACNDSRKHKGASAAG
eukprot:3275165-Prymnesium_polylepis.4